MLGKVPDMSGLELSSSVTTGGMYTYGSDQASKRIAVLDYGVKKNILRCFDDRDAYLGVFPAKTDLADILAWNPDGIFISNGPGDPAAMDYAVQTVKQALDSGKPMFGICLGNRYWRVPVV